MNQFTYSFCMAMLHSFWQAALLLLLYLVVDKIIFKDKTALAKRNFLYLSLAIQIILFIFTFAFYSFQVPVSGAVSSLAQSLSYLTNNTVFQLITPWIFMSYIFILIYKVIRGIFLWQQFKNQYQIGLLKPVIDLKLFTDLKAHQFGIKRKVTLWLSQTINTPVTFGFIKPIILIPVSLMNNISIQQAETLILHELTHIRTHDYLLNWFLIFAENIFFFNHFVAALCKQIRLEREKNCDTNVMAFEYPPVLYAETLLQAEKIKQMVPNFQLAAVNRKKELLERIQFFSSIIEFKKTGRFNIISSGIGLILLFLLSTSILFHSTAPAKFISSISLPYLPISGFEIDQPILVNQVLPEKIIKENIKQPVRNKVVKKLSTKQKFDSKSISPSIPSNNFLEESYKITPVSLQKNDAARQIIIKEEKSGSSNASIKVYYLSFENGEWVLVPEWALTAYEKQLDSVPLKSASSNIKLKKILTQQ